MKQNGNFANFFWGGGGKGWIGIMSVSLCNNNNNRNIDYRYLYMLPFKTGDFVLKTPTCFAMSFGVGIV